MASSSFKKQVITHSVITFSIIVVLFVAVTLLRGSLGRRVESIDELKRNLAVRGQATESLLRLRADGQKARLVTSSLNAALPLKDDLINFPKEMSALALSRNVELSLILGSDAGINEQLGSLSFSITTTSDYNQFLRFLEDVEAHPYFIRLNSISVSRREASDDYAGSFSGSVFYRQQSVDQ